jgi:hypothetical protein
MKRQRNWGEFTEQPNEETVAKQNDIDREIMMEKRGIIKFYDPSKSYLSQFLLQANSRFFTPQYSLSRKTVTSSCCRRIN